MTDAEQLAAIRNILRPLLGNEPCPACRPIPKKTCPGCLGTGTRDVIDGLTTVEAVERVVHGRETYRETLEAYKEANDIISRVAYVEGLNEAIHKEADRAAKLAEDITTLRAERDAARAELADAVEAVEFGKMSLESHINDSPTGGCWWCGFASKDCEAKQALRKMIAIVAKHKEPK